MEKSEDIKVAGFTMLEMMIAFGLSSMVLIVVMSTFMFSIAQSTLCSKMAWSQQEAMVTSSKIRDYIQNASKIINVNSDGTQVKLKFPDGSVRWLKYVDGDANRDGQLVLRKKVSGNFVDMQVVTRGMIGIPDGKYSPPIFNSPGTNNNFLSVAYRISEPVKSGGRAVQDSAFAVEVRFGVGLRNADI